MSAASMQDAKIFLTGGCLISTGEAVNSCYEVNGLTPGRNQRRKGMNYKRYAHCSVSLNGYLYVIGGFDNKDAEDVSPNTVNSCEKFAPYENKWYEICPIS